MEMWLRTSGKEMLFPIMPSSFNLEGSSTIHTSTVVKLGEVSVYGGNNLRRISINSFFPSRKYHFVKTPSLQEPYDYVNQIRDWMNKGQDVRFIITETDINMLCFIESFEYGEQDASRDVYFSISLVECKIPKLLYGNSNPTTNTPRPETPQDSQTSQQKTHQVKKGDCLWSIAQRYYGDGSLYPKIKEANKSKYPSLAKNNTIYTNMVLIIP